MPLAIRYRADAPEGDPLEGFARLAAAAPHPIAVPLSLVASEKRPERRFMFLLKNLLDAVLRYAALVATSDYLAGRSLPSDRVNGSLADIVRKIPSEGKWLELLRECVAACGASSLIPELGAFLRSAELDRRAQVRVSFPEAGPERDWSGKLSTWIGLRNALLAHGPSPEDIEQANTEIARLALSVLEAMQPLFSWLLIRRSSPGGQLVLRGPTKESFGRYSGTALQAEVFLAHEQEDHRFELYPLLVSGLEGEKALPEVGTENILLYDHLRSRTVVYRNESMVARMRADKFDALRSVLARRGVELTRPEVEVSTFEELQVASRAQVDRMVQREIDERRYDPTTYLVRERVERHLRTFSEGPAEALFMVGESGCGKSNTLFRYASAQAAAGDVVLIARASTLWEKGLPSLTDLEEALRREMGIKEGLDRWVKLTSEANTDRAASERSNVLLVIDQLDSFMGQGRTPGGVFRRLEELVRRHEEGRCLKLLTAMRRETVQHILAETGSEPPLGSARHYQPADEAKGPKHPSWFLTVGPLNDDEAGRLLESAMRSRGLEQIRFGELSRGWRRVLQIPYAVRRYAEACEVLGKPPRFRASLHKLEDALHAARAERRQEILMQLVRYCAEHHVADPSVDEILEAGGPLAEAVDEIGTGSDYDWLRQNGLVREDMVGLVDGTMRSQLTFSHDQIFATLYRTHARAIARYGARDTILFAAFLGLLMVVGVLLFSVIGLALLWYPFLPAYLALEAKGAAATAATFKDGMLEASWVLVKRASSVTAMITGVAILGFVLFWRVPTRLHLWLGHRIARMTPRETLEALQMEAEVPRGFRHRADLYKLLGLVLLGFALVMLRADPNPHHAGAYVVVVVPFVLAPIVWLRVHRSVYEWIRGHPPETWRCYARIAWGSASYLRYLVGYAHVCLLLLVLALMAPIAGKLGDGAITESLREVSEPLKRSGWKVLNLLDKKGEPSVSVKLRETIRDTAHKLTQLRAKSSTHMSGFLRVARLYLFLLAVLLAISIAASHLVVGTHYNRKLLAEVAQERGKTGE